MDKITVIPESVRGYGDIVSPKSLEDFLLYDAELSFEDSLYTLAYDSSGISVGLTVSSGTISVGSSVTLTAEVLSEGEPASGETVSFYDGSTLLGTDTTDSSGEATYTTSSLSVGTHSLTAVALDKSSSAVSVTVNKLTSTITLSVPSTGTVGTSYTVTGTLVPTSGSVKLYENSVLKDTLTVSSGSFSKAITQSNEGTYTYYAVFEGSSTYSGVTSSTGSIVVSDVPPVPVVTSVSLTSDKSILSNYDSESATLSATVLDQSSQPMSGVTVTFYNGSTSMGTADTNSSGVATKSYASAGSGDVSFTAVVGTISSETYGIVDAIYANSTETTLPTVNGSGNKILTLDNNLSLTLPSSFELTYTIKTSFNSVRFGIVPVANKSNKDPNYSVFGQQTSNQYVGVYRDTRVHAVGSDTSTTGTSYHNWKIKRTNNTFQWYFDNVQINSDVTLSWFDTYTPHTLACQYWNNGTAKVKDIILKAL